MQKGMSLTSFLVLTIKTNPLGMAALFTITDIGVRAYLKKNGKMIKSNLVILIGSFVATLVTGPLLLYWTKELYYKLNDKLGDLTEDFFNYTSALGLS